MKKISTSFLLLILFLVVGEKSASAGWEYFYSSTGYIGPSGVVEIHSGDAVDVWRDPDGTVHIIFNVTYNFCCKVDYDNGKIDVFVVNPYPAQYDHVVVVPKP